MTHDFELYHGAALRDLIITAGRPLEIKSCDDAGRINSYVINNKTSIYIKHSAKRLPPWQFTFNAENVEEISRLRANFDSLWLVLVCGCDGSLALSTKDFDLINPTDFETTSFVRVDRDRGTMYRLTGTGGKLPRKRPRGMSMVVSEIFNKPEVD